MRSLWLTLGMVLPLAAEAQQFGPGAAKQVGLPDAPLEQLILRIINTALILAAVVALGFLVYGGFRYITSRGDEREVESAKDTITYAVIGLVVLGIAAAIVNFVVGAVLGT
ncbi:MAG: pilin [bacterium]|nr:pilin [bacterium]